MVEKHYSPTESQTANRDSTRTRGRLLATEAKKRITRSKLIGAHTEADKLVTSFTVDPVSALMLCALMYWCEGSKSKNDSEFTFTNPDPVTVAGFLTLLRKALLIDESRFRVKMHLHAYHNENRQKDYWSRITGIPKNQFQSTYLKQNSGVTIKPNYQGCVHVRYHDVRVARKISAVARIFLTRLNVIQ